MNALDRYLRAVTDLLSATVDKQSAALECSANLIAEALGTGRFLYAFGTGHSHLLAEEIFYRAGGLVRAAAILDPPLMLHESASGSSHHEQQTDYAKQLLGKYPVAAGDVLVIASNSGRNAVPIEMAEAGHCLGMKTIAITSLAHSRAFPSRHPSGKRLYEVTDVVLDNLAPPGDAVLDLPGLTRRIGPVSTLSGAFLLNAMVVRAIELALAKGRPPEIYASSNAEVPEWNDSLLAQYRGRIRHL